MLDKAVSTVTSRLLTGPYPSEKTGMTFLRAFPQSLPSTQWIPCNTVHLEKPKVDQLLKKLRNPKTDQVYNYHCSILSHISPDQTSHHFNIILAFTFRFQKWFLIIRFLTKFLFMHFSFSPHAPHSSGTSRCL